MQNSIAKEIRVWLPTQVIFVGEWGFQTGQGAANRVAHALAPSSTETVARKRNPRLSVE
jgi:hypothetical protein